MISISICKLHSVAKQTMQKPGDLRNADDPVVLLGEDKDPSLGDALHGNDGG